MRAEQRAATATMVPPSDRAEEASCVIRSSTTPLVFLSDRAKVFIRTQDGFIIGYATNETEVASHDGGSPYCLEYAEQEIDKE